MPTSAPYELEFLSPTGETLFTWDYAEVNTSTWPFPNQTRGRLFLGSSQPEWQSPFVAKQLPDLYMTLSKRGQLAKEATQHVNPPAPALGGATAQRLRAKLAAARKENTVDSP
jgi:hypothetical protein